MTVEEAIERNHDLCGSPHMRDMHQSIEAIKLGIEALKRCRYNYLNTQRADFRRLPGETEE